MINIDYFIIVRNTNNNNIGTHQQIPTQEFTSMIYQIEIKKLILKENSKETSKIEFNENNFKKI